MQEPHQTLKVSCKSCGAPANTQAKFCASCGKSLQTPALRKSSLLPATLLSAVVTALLYFSVTALSPVLTGLPPTQTFRAPEQINSQRASADQALPPSPKIAELRSRLNEDADNPKRKLELAIELSNQATAQLPVRTEFVEEAIGLLLEVKSVEQDNAQARIILADSYFSLQRFDLAIQEYQQLLDASLGDKDGIQSKLASTYAFTGEFDKAIELLEQVLDRNPNNFQALAYLSIAHSQKGDTDSALEIGNKALNAAPSSEARQRFQKFFETLSPHKSSTANGSAASQIVDAIQNNPIAGSKFISFEEQGNTLKLYFENFPMQAMPPVAREKFLGKLRELKGDIQEIQFIDRSTAETMEVLK